MSPRPEDSPISSPRTRSPAKGVRTGGVSCAGPDALSMLNMLAEVASVTLHTDPSVTDTAQTCRVKVCVLAYLYVYEIDPSLYVQFSAQLVI